MDPGPASRSLSSGRPKAGPVGSAPGMTRELVPHLASHYEHDLAEMLVGAHVRLRFHRLIEGKADIDGEPQLAGTHRIPKVRAHAAADLADLVEGAGAEGHTDIIDAPQCMQVEIEFSLGARETADIDDAAEDGGRLHGLGDHGAGEHIDDEV